MRKRDRSLEFLLGLDDVDPRAAGSESWEDYYSRLERLIESCDTHDAPQSSLGAYASHSKAKDDCDDDVVRQLVNRRAFLGGITRIAAMLTGAAAIGPAANALGSVSSEMMRDYLRIGNSIKAQPTKVSGARIEALSELLLPRNFKIDYSVAKIHVDEPATLTNEFERGFPQDRKALAAFRHLDPTMPDVDITLPRDEVIEPDASLVIAGSPMTNRDTQEFLPYSRAEAPDRDLSVTFNSEQIPYHFVIGANRKLMIRSGRKNGKVRLVRDHSIMKSYSREVWQPRELMGPDDFLKTDFVIVSRLPRVSNGGDVILISGGHGAGVAAFRLLFDRRAFPDSEFGELYDALRGSQHFQFVLEASDISHDEDMSTARRIRISSECPPVRIHAQGIFRSA